jgi:hypothetical protein
LKTSGVTNLIGTTSSTSFAWHATFGMKHHSPAYNILCDFPHGLNPNDIFLRLRNESPKTKTLIILKFWNTFISSSNQTFSEHVRAISYNFLKYIFNGLLHIPIRNHLTPALWGFMVRSQIPNLIFGHSLDHNSCILGLNEQCKGILGIFTSRPF